MTAIYSQPLTAFAPSQVEHISHLTPLIPEMGIMLDLVDLFDTIIESDIFDGVVEWDQQIEDGSSPMTLAEISTTSFAFANSHVQS